MTQRYWHTEHLR